VRWHGSPTVALCAFLGAGLSGCTGQIEDLPPNENPCFSGTYGDHAIVMHVVHRRGLISAVAVPRAGSDVPWEFLTFEGNVLRGLDEAEGTFRVHFPPQCPDDSCRVPVEQKRDQTLMLTGGLDCAARRTLSFSFLHSEGMETRTLRRSP
jgi:hypothetical protein